MQSKGSFRKLRAVENQYPLAATSDEDTSRPLIRSELNVLSTSFHEKIVKKVAGDTLNESDTSRLRSNSSSSDIPLQGANKKRVSHSNLKKTIKKPRTKNLSKEKRKNFQRCHLNNCKFSCNTIEELKEHFNCIHKMKVEIESREFKNMDEFYQWKINEEMESFSVFIRDGLKTSKDNSLVIYLKCHRSGNCRSKLVHDKGTRKRVLKKTGYTQIGIKCTAKMKVIKYESGEVKVAYFKTHNGHTCDEKSLQFMRLKTKQRSIIADELLKGETVSNVCKKLKALKQFMHVKHKHVYNVGQKLDGLKKLKHDSFLITEWFEKLGHYNSKAIVYHELQDSTNSSYIVVLLHPLQKLMFSLASGIILAYVKTKRRRSNVDFKLTTLFLVDKLGLSFPLAYLVSSAINPAMLTVFFSVIKGEVGTIDAVMFISNDNTLYYPIWKKYMTKCEKVLRCYFDLEEKWGDMLSVLPPEKFLNFFSKLKDLLREKEKETFRAMLQEVLCIMTNNNDFTKFSNYFAQNFSTSSYEWSRSYRENIDEFLQPLNDSIQELYLRNILNKTCCIDSLFNYTREYCLNYCLKTSDLWAKQKLNESLKIHEESLTIVDEIEVGNNFWQIDGYVVKRGENCVVSNCVIQCMSCDVCVHSYQCSCTTYMHEFVICKHIHGVVSKNREYEEEYLLDEYSDNSQLIDQEWDDSNLMEEDVNTISSLEEKDAAISIAKQLVQHLESSNLSQEAYANICKNIDDIINNQVATTKSNDSE